MQFRTLVAATVALAAGFAHAGSNFEVYGISVEYPHECANSCGPVVTQSGEADNQGDVCNGPHMQDQIPKCDYCTSTVSGEKWRKYHRSKYSSLRGRYV